MSVTTRQLDDVIRPTPTPRVVIDPARKCSLRCKFCYYLPQDDFYSVREWDSVEGDVRAASERGCTHADITGGEPLQYPDIARLVSTCVGYGIQPRIITSLIGAERVLDAVLDAGVDDWLISMHGATPETHNSIVQVKNARTFQIRRLAKIAERMRYCANYVMIAQNQHEIAEWAKWIVSQDWRLPRIVNFINFNPHYDWKNMREGMMANIVDLRVAGPQLDHAIDILEDNGVGVNVRYFPMCALAERHRKSVCNDLHVAFDSGEWDNAFANDKSQGNAYVYGHTLSMGNEEKGEPCSSCSLQWVCGGANKLWHEASREKHGEQLLPIVEAPPDCHPKDYYYYRRHNARGMA